MQTNPLWLLLPFIVGMGMAVQTGVNTLLARHVGGPLPAALISFAGGCLLLAMLSLPLLLGHGGGIAWGQTRWWHWSGGLFGAAAVAVSIWAAPRIGAANLAAWAIAGQMSISLLLDRYGALGYPQQDLTPARALGALLLVAGVILLRRG